MNGKATIKTILYSESERAAVEFIIKMNISDDTCDTLLTASVTNEVAHGLSVGDTWNLSGIPRNLVKDI